jgi:hypothetical protein
MIEYALLPAMTRRFMTFQRLSVLTGSFAPCMRSSDAIPYVKARVDVNDRALGRQGFVQKLLPSRHSRLITASLQDALLKKLDR